MKLHKSPPNPQSFIATVQYVLPICLLCTAGKDFVPPSPSLVPFSIGQRRACIQVGIIDDSVHEQTEVFAVRMDSESSAMPQEVAAGRTNLSRLSIRDNDSELTQPCSVDLRGVQHVC